MPVKCGRCGKELSAEQVYTRDGKPVCESCLMQAGLFPLGHTGHYKRLFSIKDRKRQG